MSDALETLKATVWISTHLGAAAGSIAQQVSELRRAATLQGKRAAYEDVRRSLEQIGFGQIDEAYGEEVEINGADCVDAMATLYERISDELIRDEAAAVTACVQPLVARATPDVSDRDESQRTLSLAMSLIRELSSLSLEEEMEGGVIDLGERSLVLDDAVSRARVIMERLNRQAWMPHEKGTRLPQTRAIRAKRRRSDGAPRHQPG